MYVHMNIYIYVCIWIVHNTSVCVHACVVVLVMRMYVYMIFLYRQSKMHL